jgi:hypothetical protein
MFFVESQFTPFQTDGRAPVYIDEATIVEYGALYDIFGIGNRSAMVL